MLNLKKVLHNKISIKSSGNLCFDVRKISFAFFVFSAVMKFCSRCPLIVGQELVMGFQTDNVILFRFAWFQKHFVIIITAFRVEGCFAKKCCYLLHGLKGNRICRRVKTFFLHREI